MRVTLRSVFGFVAGITVAAEAMAGGIALREQSTVFQGTAFAGDAAGGALSSSFWNPAALTDAKAGFNTKSAASAIFGNSTVTTRPGTTFPVPAGPLSSAAFIGSETDISRPALIGASYSSYRLNKDLVLGLSVTSPWGLSTEASNSNWGGQYHGRSGNIFSLNVSPMASYDIMPGLTIGGGAQVQYARISFKAALDPIPGLQNAGFEVDDVAFGGSLGVLWKPVAGTSIGLGWRSAIKHNFEGNYFSVAGTLTAPVPGVGLVTRPFADGGLAGDVTLPDVVTLSFRQSLDSRTRVLGTAEWTQWSKFGTVVFSATSSGGAPLLGAPITTGQAVNTFAFNWHDAWMFSLGGEYDISPTWTVRAGAAYERSPIQNANERFTLITDSNRIWLSSGTSFKLNDTVSLDLAYSHIFFADASIDRTTTTSGKNFAFEGDVSTHIDIVSAGLRVNW